MVEFAVLGAVVLVVVGFVVTYNAVVRKRNAVRNAWAQIDVQLKRRHDLIPNLVAVVKGHAGHERQTLAAVTAARARAMGAGAPAERAMAEHALSAAVQGVFAISESYPTLLASKSFLRLQQELVDSENRIAYSRQYYNDAVLTYNNAIQVVPGNVIAGMARMRASDYFRTPDEERGAVQVRF
jgi:LemA protein